MKFIVILLILYFIYEIYITRYEYFNNNKPYFMSKDETIKFFKEDTDNYYVQLAYALTRWWKPF